MTAAAARSRPAGEKPASATDSGRKLAVTYRSAADLVPYSRNARTHSDAQVDQIVASIGEFGFTNPILVDGDGGVIAGHGRLMAARKMGIEKVPVILLTDLTEAQRRAYVIADNKLALNAGWDSTLLALELDDLGSAGFDLGLAGFAADELKSLLPAEATAPENFRGFDETLETEHRCPKCNYVWSGKKA